MASRVNVKFILFLVIVLIGGAGAAGGLWMYQVRNKASRNVAMGDKFHEAGDYDRARRFYSRAIKREPGRLDYLEKLETTLLSTRPGTADEAQELYAQRLGILKHVPQHYPFDADAHVRYLDELLHIARLTGTGDAWEMVAAASDEMWNRVPASDPKRKVAKLYRGMAGLGRIDRSTPEAVEAAEQDLMVVVEAMPDSDLAWASLASGQLATANKLRLAGKVRRAEEKLAQAETTIRHAFEKMPDGREVAKVALARLLYVREIESEAVTAEQLTEAIDRLVALVGPESDPWLVPEVVGMLEVLPDHDGPARARALLQRYLEAHPDAHHPRIRLARIQYYEGELDEADRNVETILAAEQLPVSLYARMQFVLRKEAAALQGDIAFVRWRQAPETERATHRDELVAIRDRLAAMVADPDNEPLLLQLDGKLAVAEGNYRRAAGKFETVISRYRPRDPELLLASADCLQRIGNSGMALERAQAAVALRPDVPLVLFEQARLQRDTGQPDAASRTLGRLLEIDPTFEPALRLASIIAHDRPETGRVIDDPLIQTISGAQALLTDGDVESARAMLAGAIEADPENTQLIVALLRMEMTLGNKDSARVHLDRALELEPNNLRLRGLRAAMERENPIESFIEFVAAISESDSDRAVSLAVNLPLAASRYEALAEQLEARGDTEAAATARGHAEFARREAAVALEAAGESAPDNPRLVEYQFYRALNDQDWSKAGEMVQQAERLNLDEAGGLLYRGRLETVQGRYQDAVRTLTEVTSQIPYSSLAWRTLGVAQQQLGNLDEAVRAFEQAQRSNPSDKGILLQYVRVLGQAGEQTRALLLLQRTRTVFADDVEVREVWLDLEAEVGRPDLVLTERAQRYRQAPGDERNAIRLAELLVSTEPTPELIVDDDGNPIYTPLQWGRFSRTEQRDVLARLKGVWVARADHILAGLRQRSGDTLALAQLEATLLEKQGRIRDGAVVLESFIRQQAETARTADMYIALGEYLDAAGETAAAVEVIEEAIKIQDDDRREADHALARLCFDRGAFSRAATHFERVLEATGDPIVRLRLVESKVRAGDLDAAEALLDAHEAEGSGYVTTMLRATIAEGRADALFARGDAAGGEAALRTYRRALADAGVMRPWDPTPKLTEARNLLRQYRRTPERALLDDALLALDRADEIRAGNPLSSMVRVDVLREMGDRRGAMGELKRLLDRHPDHVGARREVVRLHIEDGDPEAALAVLEEAVVLFPTSPTWHQAIGELQASHLQDYAAAVDGLAHAYGLRPTAERAARLASAMLSVERPDYAKVLALLGNHAEAMETDPATKCLTARALGGLDRRPEAMETLREAYALFGAEVAEGGSRAEAVHTWFTAIRPVFAAERPADAEAFVLDVCGSDVDSFVLTQLATLWVNAGAEGMSRAIELQGRAIEAASADDRALRAQLHMRLADLHLAAGANRQAADAYGAAVELDPNDPVARNNYAYLLGDILDEPERALPHAQRAAELRPRDASIRDTAGWVAFKAGRVDEAEEHLTESLRLQALPTTHLHLAHLYVSREALDRAERHLRLAAEMSPDPATTAEINALSDDIRTRRNRGQ